MRSKAADFRSFYSKFPFNQWNYHESIQNGDMGITTNPLENINLKLKSKMPKNKGQNPQKGKNANGAF